MARFYPRLVVVSAVTLLAAGAAGAQTWASSGYRLPAVPWAGTWAGGSAQDQLKVNLLNQNIALAQLDLWALKQRGADWRAICAKRNEVLQYRFDLARLLTDLPPGSALATGPLPFPPPPSGQGFAAPPTGCPLPGSQPDGASQQQQQGSGQQQQSGGGQQQQQ